MELAGFEPAKKEKGCVERIAPRCTLSQNGYGDCLNSQAVTCLLGFLTVTCRTGFGVSGWFKMLELVGICVFRGLGRFLYVYTLFQLISRKVSCPSVTRMGARLVDCCFRSNVL